MISRRTYTRWHFPFCGLPIYPLLRIRISNFHLFPATIVTSIMISVIFLVVLAAGVLGQKTPVDQATLSNLTRYAHFASAAYSSDCTIPPYGTTVVTYFDEASTDTQATLFRDDSAKEYILSYRGTSNLQDFLADNDQTLVACSQITGISCTTCNVSSNAISVVLRDLADR